MLKLGRIQKHFQGEVQATEWAFDRTKEAFEQVAQDEAGKLSIVPEIMIRSTDYLWRIIAPVGGQGGVTMSHLCPDCSSFPLEDCIRWVSREKGATIGGARCVEKDDRKQPDRLLVVQTGERIDQAEVFKAHAVDYDWFAFFQAFVVKATKEKTRGEMCEAHKEMSRAVG